MPIALETFLMQLSESGILTDQKLKSLEHKKAAYHDGESLAWDMIKSGQLTKYQAEQILGGKGKNLCMGQYVLLEKLGAGGMGQVYKAYHPGMERMVAIKVILAKGNADLEAVKRFEREIKAAAKLAHPNIITVYDAGNSNGRHFMVMELVKGEDLSEIISKKGKLDVKSAVDYITQAAKGLKFAHANGVVHRDIKPGNLILDGDGVLKIVDMGLAKIRSKENDDTVSMLTGNAAIMGTVDFMSPEQSLSTKNVDERADIYSLGATLYYILTGNVMYPGKTAMVKLMAHRKSLIPSLRLLRTDVSENLDAVYTKMVAKEINHRYQNMSELICDLELIAKGIPPHLKSKGMATINSSENDFAGFQFNKKGTNLKLGKSTINLKEVLSNKKLLSIIGSVLVGLISLIFFMIIFVLGGVKKAKQVSSENDKTDIKYGVADIFKDKKSSSTNLKQYEVKGVFLNSPFSESTAKESQSALANNLNRFVEEKEDLGNGVNLEMVLIPAGKFMMGSPVADAGRFFNGIQHEVTLTKPFYIGKYEVTQEQWQAVMGKNPSYYKGPKLPVIQVSWEDCRKFVSKINAKTNGGYRLPTEAEWEYACRAGTTTEYSFGDSITKNEANVEGNSIKMVGSYKPNSFGLFDMHGNVWEWCEDWKVDYSTDAVTDPMGAANGKYRVLRGGSFTNSGSHSRSSNWWCNYPSTGNVDYMGVRLARTIDIKAGVVPTELKPDPVAVIPITGDLLVSPFSEAKAKEKQKELSKKLLKEIEGKEDLGKGITLEMVLIPAGKFMMGSPVSESGRINNENQHEVTLTKSFYMGKYEVTQDQWQAVMGNNPSTFKGSILPVTNVNWQDCHEFIKKLNDRTEGRYRLPTEAEWEYACRAGTVSRYSFGEESTPKDANFVDSKIGKPVAVGSYKPNWFGLYDMHGNVSEWCEDWYGGNYPLGTVTDPKIPVTGQYRVLRGGSFSYNVTDVRSSKRVFASPANRYHDLGFRLVRIN